MSNYDDRRSSLSSRNHDGAPSASPGEAIPCHRDPFHRVAVVLSGDVLSIEYRDGGESQRVEIMPGQVEWEEPSASVHRAVNVGKEIYEQITVFLLDEPDAVVQPTE